MVIFITGASSGIGAALAKQYAQVGARLVLCARRRSRLEALAEQCRQLNAQTEVLIVECDVTKRADLDHAVAQTLRQWGAINIVIANAGFSVAGMVEDLQFADFQRQFDTNVNGVLHTVQATLPALKASRGRLSIIGSVCSYAAFKASAAYCMSKYSVRALGEALWLELKPFGVSVTMIYPGFVESEIHMVDNEGKPKSGERDFPPRWLIMPADKAARQIVAAIDAGKAEAVITGHGKLLVWLSRFFPGLMRFMFSFDKATRRAASSA